MKKLLALLIALTLSACASVPNCKYYSQNPTVGTITNVEVSGFRFLSYDSAVVRFDVKVGSKTVAKECEVKGLDAVEFYNTLHMAD
jgi:hypothetical protein